MAIHFTHKDFSLMMELLRKVPYSQSTKEMEQIIILDDNFTYFVWFTLETWNIISGLWRYFKGPLERKSEHLVIVRPWPVRGKDTSRPRFNSNLGKRARLYQCKNISRDGNLIGEKSILGNQIALSPRPGILSESWKSGWKYSTCCVCFSPQSSPLILILRPIRI